MSRSLKKGPYVDPRLIKKISQGVKGPIKTWSRACVITPEMIGFTFEVHNGKNFIRVMPKEEMVGHRLGEFSPTRTFRRHGGKMAREQEQEIQAKEAGKARGISAPGSDSAPGKGTKGVKPASPAPAPTKSARK